MKGVGSVNRDAERTERNIPLTRRAPAPICVDVHAPKQAGGPGDVGRAVAVRRLAAFNTPQRRGPSEANDAMPSLVIRTLIFDGVCGTRGRYHGTGSQSGRLSGTGMRVSAGSPGPLREEAARPWPCLSGLSDPGTGLQTALRPLDWMPRSLVTSARGLRWKLRRAEASSGVSGGKLVPSRAAIRK